MDLNTYMGYRVTEQEIAQPAARAERARLAAERPDQVVPRIGIVRRTLAALAARRVPTAAVTTGQRTTGPRTAAPRPAASHAAAPRGSARAVCERVGNTSDRTPHPA
ncbi:hypothetical protein [Leucobacter sp. OLDS2]|uniref:hypothetical protein n=1 Tax=Leucobacter sp. OLDS2 TaxID=1914919 RepID=UPI000C177B0A|nr:hypothetical protein [Leucobacter sp. OLDS2]PIJ00083.1 hypothetical protein BMH29_01705 [Leucobacter sp. OLDS2]